MNPSRFSMPAVFAAIAPPAGAPVAAAGAGVDADGVRALAHASANAAGAARSRWDRRMAGGTGEGAEWRLGESNEGGGAWRPRPRYELTRRSAESLTGP